MKDILRPVCVESVFWMCIIVNYTHFSVSVHVAVVTAHMPVVIAFFKSELAVLSEITRNYLELEGKKKVGPEGKCPS